MFYNISLTHVLIKHNLKIVCQKSLHVIKTIQSSLKGRIIRNEAAYEKRFAWLISPKRKEIYNKKLGNSFRYNKLHFYQLFKTKFKLEETGKLPFYSCYLYLRSPTVAL